MMTAERERDDCMTDAAQVTMMVEDDKIKGTERDRKRRGVCYSVQFEIGWV